MDLDHVRAAARNHLSRLQQDRAVAEHEVRRIGGEYAALEAEQASDRDRAELFVQGIAGFNLLLERTVTTNLKHLQDDVNRALKAIIPDQDLRFEVIPDVKWDKKVYSFAILHDGVAHTDAEGIGGTVLAVVSMVLRVMFILSTKRYPLLVLDESLRFISKSHKARASEFVRALAEAMKVHILLITHDEAFAVAADVNYTAQAPAPGQEATGSKLTRISREEVRDYFRSEI